MTKIAIIDYGSGNLRSAAKGFEREVRALGAETRGKYFVSVTSDPSEVARADKIVLPGVGAFADCKLGLEAIPGMIEALNEAVRAKGRPFLGICVGMQLMAERGLEHGEHKGLGWLAGTVRPLAPADESLKIPHMGWNELKISEPAHPVFKDLDADGHAYFVHSYHLVPDDPALICAESDYGGRVVAAIARDNMVGTQFHPEKSQKLGLKLIRNFLEWLP